MNFVRTTIAGLALAAGLGAGAAYAEEMKMMTELSGSEEVPPVETSATGMTDIMYNSENGMLTWTLEYSGLSGDATAAHFHGPADEGENAPPVVPIEEFASGSEGSAEITAEQAEQMMAGKWYVNVHTAANPGGEIRGQVMTAAE